MTVASEPQDKRSDNIGMLYGMYRKALFKFLSRKVGPEDASDLLQDTFVRLYQSETNIKNLNNKKAFIFRVASNLAIDHSRKVRRSNRLLNNNEVEALLAVPDEAARPDQAAQARIEGQYLARALAEMPLRRAEVFRLSRLDGLSHQVIATRLGVSVRTVEAEIRMALDHCAERLGRIRPSC